VRPQEEYDKVLALVSAGNNDTEIARLTAIPRGTVRDWRRGPHRGSLHRAGRCPICAGASIDVSAYSYLLGLYLGDGYLATHRRGVFRLRISMDKRYPNIIREAADAMKVVNITGAVGVLQRTGCVEIASYWRHWPCVFPQHGPGRKQERRIRLTGWQEWIVQRYPDRLLRGLIHSDGWRGTNGVHSAGKAYDYPRYQFTNYSKDIRAIFCQACDDFGISWRQMNRVTVSVARRHEVAKLDRVVGPKC
jgi:hypothetical protein